MCQPSSLQHLCLHPPGSTFWSRSRLLPFTSSTKVASHLELRSSEQYWIVLDSGLSIVELNSGLHIANYQDFRSRQRNSGARGKRKSREIRGHEDYKVKPKRSHCYGHTPRIQKGLKRPTLAWNEIPFVTMFYSHDVCVAWAHLRLTNLELAVEVIPSYQSFKNWYSSGCFVGRPTLQGQRWDWLARCKYTVTG